MTTNEGGSGMITIATVVRVAEVAVTITKPVVMVAYLN